MRTKNFYGEFAFLIGITVLSMGITLMIKSNFGMPPAASLPYILSRVFSGLTFGTWNYLLQMTSIIILVCTTRHIINGYYWSFFLVIGFGYMLDLFNYLFGFLPMGLLLQTVYWVIGLLALSFGVSILMMSHMPIMPFDTFVRDISRHFKIPLKNVRTCFDLTFVVLALNIAMVFIGNYNGIGLGTLVSAMVTGKLISTFVQLLDKSFRFKFAIKLLNNVS